MDFNELMQLISTASDSEIRMLREAVAPITKLQRLQQEASDLAQRVNAGGSAAQNLVAAFASKVHNNDLTATPPTWDELVAAFRG